MMKIVSSSQHFFSRGMILTDNFGFGSGSYWSGYYRSGSRILIGKQFQIRADPNPDTQHCPQHCNIRTEHFHPIHMTFQFNKRYE